MPSDNSFGAFVTSKWKLRDVSLRGFAEQLGISPVYNGKNLPLSYLLLAKNL